MNKHFLLTVGVALLGLAGCSGDQEEIQGWMQQEAQRIKPHVEPIHPPRKFEPEAYVGASGADPFSVGKMISGTRAGSNGSNALLAAEMKRRKDPLEAYPLDSMKMVGLVIRQGQPHALIKVDNLLHYVKVGDYLGQNFGKITHITETEIDLREIVQDASGEWVESTSSLQLQESGK